MCFAVPLQVVETIDETNVVLEGHGVRIKANTTLTPDLKVGDDCLVHAGFVIEKITAEDAREKSALLNEFYEKVGRNE